MPSEHPLKRTPVKPFLPGNQLAKGGPGPVGNSNNLQSGLRGEGLRTLKLGKLPDRTVAKHANEFRRWLEAWTLKVHGTIEARAELAINSATKHEIAGLLITRWLRLRGETMNHDQRLKYAQALAREADLRDMAVARLKLDESPASIIDALYSSPTAADLEGES